MQFKCKYGLIIENISIYIYMYVCVCKWAIIDTEHYLTIPAPLVLQ